MPQVDLGKVHFRAYLYNTIPGVIRDPEKLRGNYTFALGLSDQNAQPVNYNVVSLVAYAKDGNVLSGALIPEPIYEPVDNFILSKTNASKSSTTDVYWKQIGTGGKPFDAVRSRFVSSYLPQMDPLAVSRNLQKWISQQETVRPERYSAQEYSEQYITYDGSGFVPQKNSSGNEDTSTEADKQNNSQSTATVDATGIEEPSTGYFARQVESSPGVWWGVETVSPFKDKGYPFWVVIRPDAINVSNKSKASAFVSIVISELDGAAETSSGSSSPTGYVELVIMSGGRAFLHQVNRVVAKSGSSSAGSKSQASPSGTADPKKSTGNTTDEQSEVVSTMAVDIPWITDAFTGLQEMRIGFMSVMGRLCIYTSPDRSHVVTLLDSQGNMAPFNLKTPRLSVYGYGCRCSVMSCVMTFKQRGWMTCPDMMLDEASGHTYPLQEDRAAGIGVGDCSDGRLISRVNSDTGLMSAREKGRNGKIYGAVFREYMEVDQTLDEQAGNKRVDNTKLTITESNYETGMINPWGKVHIVRSGPVVGLHDQKPFWFIYLEADKLSSQMYTANGDAVRGVQGDRGYAGFPAFYNMSAFKPEDKKLVTSITDSQYSDISSDVVSFSCNYQLDSPRPIMVEYSGTLKVFNSGGVYSQYLAKARGITVWMKWSPESSVSFSDSDIVYSGIAFGRDAAQAPGEEYVTFELADHWKILEGMPIKNSPFYDGFHISTVVEDLCAHVGIGFVDDVDKTKAKNGGPGYYFLGAGLAYDKPVYRFSGETSLKDCIIGAMKAFELYLYFDKSGKLHMVPVPGGFQWSYTNAAWDPSVYDTYYLEIGQSAAPHRLILDGITLVSALSSSVFNSFYLNSVDRGTGALIVAARQYKESLTNPDAVGYLGFVKETRYTRTDLGNIAATERFINSIRDMHSKPGYNVEFNTIGHNPNCRPGQFIELKKNKDTVIDGGDASASKFRVTSISHDYQSANNQWKTSISAYHINAPDDLLVPVTETASSPTQE